MTEKKQPPAAPPAPKPGPPTRPHKHGYRGYGSGFSRGSDSYGGAIHVPSGLAGVGTFETPPTITPVKHRK